MEETLHLNMIHYLNEEIERELVAYPSVDRCAVKKLTRDVSKEILHAYHWGPRLASAPFPKGQNNPSAAEAEIFIRALKRALERAGLDLQ